MTIPFWGTWFLVEIQGLGALAGGDDAACGVAAGQDDSAAVDLAGWGAGWVKIRAGLGDERAAAGWAGGQVQSLVDAGMALLADMVHLERLHWRL
jgi:hypothetical protein